ncbi:MAG: Polyferredoxin, partial [Parcubacteria group bacterium GW2011_GWB2_40_8]
MSEEITTRKKLIRNGEKPIQKYRFIVQLLFAALCIWIGVEFYLFVKYLETGGSASYFTRPPGVDGFLPISSLMSFYYFLTTGTIHSAHPAGMFIFFGIVLMSLVIGKSFCSWLCPIGLLTELIGDFGEKIFKRKIQLPRFLDYPLRSLKYLMLGFLFYAVFFLMTSAALKAFLDSPYNLVADVKMYYFFAGISRFSLIVISILFVLSVVIRNFWCRYLCPYGALLGIASLLYLAGCIEADYTEDVQALGLEIEALIPETINSNFILPVEEPYEITYSMDSTVFTNEFIYESPVYDQDKEFKFTISRGKTTQEFTKTVYVLSSESGENETKLYLDLPILESQISKEDYTQANVRVETRTNGVYGITHETTEAQLRGRGNSTWFSYPKRPYRLRFDKNTSILGMPEAKNYVLLAEFADRSLMRNVVVQKMASLFTDKIYDLETRYVELYINNEYRGLYVLTEQVETHKNKLSIESIPGEINTGYFMELDMRLRDQPIDPGHFWFIARGYPYEIKEPDPEDPLYIDAQTAYLADYLSVLDQTLMDHSDYEDYMDVDAWVDYFIIQEFVKNVDIGFSSVFLYKEKDGVIKPGPLWDFD